MSVLSSQAARKIPGKRIFTRIHKRFLGACVPVCAGAVFILSATAWGSASDEDRKSEGPLSRAERSDFEETSRYGEVLEFFRHLQRQSPLVRREIFGHTVEGRDLPLIILSNPPLYHPREAWGTGKPIVFVMANIHAGEVEGKEAVQHLARRIVSGDLRPLLERMIILLVPIYNADGNERISMEHRTDQYGPIGGVGTRANAQEYDLNRDYMKLEAPETRGLIELFNRWDPHVIVDLHTTNGSYHGYQLTYSIPLNPSTDPRLTAYHRQQMMPAIAKAMAQTQGYRTYYYGNIEPVEKEGPDKNKPSWAALTHLPRVGTNYGGLRNRFTILSEAYSHLPFKERIEVTTAFLEEIFQYTALHGPEMMRLVRQLDEDAIRLGLGTGQLEIGVEYEKRPLPEPVEVLVGKVANIVNPRSGRPMEAMVKDAFTLQTMLDCGQFTITRSARVPSAYLFAREEGLQTVLDKLRGQGIAVEEILDPLTIEVEQFVIRDVQQAAVPFQGHRETRILGEFRRESRAFPAGTVIVRTAQPLARLAAYLLEPESDDGLVNWNFLDRYLAPGKIYPIYKAGEVLTIPSRLLK